MFEGIGFRGKKQEVTPPQQTPNTDMTEFMKIVQGLLGEMQEVRQQVIGLQQQRQERFPAPDDEFQGQQRTPSPAKPRFADMAAEDLQIMGDAEKFNLFGDELREDLVSTIKEVIAPITKQLSDMSARSSQYQAQTEIEKIKTEKGSDGKLLRPDFEDWRGAMAELQKTSPGLSIKQLYDYTKLDNKETELGKRIAEKYAPSFTETPRDNVHPIWNGLAPDLMKKTIDGGDLDLDSAAEKALAEVRETRGNMPPPDSMSQAL